MVFLISFKSTEIFIFAHMKGSIQRYNATVLKFDKQGEKTGWTYIVIPADLAQKINPGVKKSYRIKGRLDHHEFSGLTILPMGEGEFILPLNAQLRKAIGKKAGTQVAVVIEFDASEYRLNPELMACLEDEPEALKIFKSLPVSHQRYYSKWIDSAKTDPTKAKRIALAVNSFLKKQTFAEMLRSQSI